MNFLELIYNLVERVLNFLRSFTKYGRIRVTTVISFILIFSLSSYIIFETIYSSYFVPMRGNYYINPEQDLKTFGYEQLWLYRVTFTRLYNWSTIKDCFLTSEGYDFTLGGIIWCVSIKTIFRTLQECYWLYAFNGLDTIWSYQGTVNVMNFLNPIVRLPSTLIVCFSEFRAYYLDEWSHSGRFHNILKPYRFQPWAVLTEANTSIKFYYLSLPNYLREIALDTKAYGSDTNKLVSFVSPYLYTNVVTSCAIIYNIFSYLFFIIKSLLFVFYSLVLVFSTGFMYIGLGSLLGYLFYKVINVIFLFYWLYYNYLSGWEFKLWSLIPTIVGVSWVIITLVLFVVFCMWGVFWVPVAILDHIKQLPAVCFRSLMWFLDRFVVNPVKTYHRFWASLKLLIFYKRTFRVRIWDNLDMLNAWGKAEEDKSTPITGIPEDVAHRSKRTGKKLVYIFIPILVTYVLLNYKVWFESFSMFAVKEFTQVYWKTFFGYPQRFFLNTFWERLPNSNSHVGNVYNSIINDWSLFNYLNGKVYANYGEVDTASWLREKRSYLKTEQSPNLENYEFYRFIVLPTFACVLPSVILIYMSRKIRLMLWPFYDTVGVLFFCMFFFYTFGTLTVGYSFFLRLWFDFVFQELHEGPLYRDIINSHAVDLVGSTKVNHTVALYQAIDNALHHVYHKREFDMFGESFKKDSFFDSEASGLIPVTLPYYDDSHLYGRYGPFGTLTYPHWVELKDHWARSDQWADDRIFNTYYHGGTNTGVDEVPHLMKNLIADRTELKLIHRAGGGMKKNSFMDLLMYRKYYADNNRAKFYKHGYPKAYSIPTQMYRNYVIDQFNRKAELEFWMRVCTRNNSKRCLIDGEATSREYAIRPLVEGIVKKVVLTTLKYSAITTGTVALGVTGVYQVATNVTPQVFIPFISSFGHIKTGPMRTILPFIVDIYQVANSYKNVGWAGVEYFWFVARHNR